MALRVMNNIQSMETRRLMSVNNRDLGMRVARLSSGLRINGASDDASGLSVSEGMRSLISGVTQGIRNAEMANDMLEIAEGSLNEISSILIRLRELAVQSASSTYNNSNREAIQAEYSQLINEIDRITESTSYNNMNLLTGTGNTVSSISTVSGSASSTTGVTRVSLSGADAGTYTFIDTSNTDNQITLGNGVVTQTIDIGTLLDEGMVATGTSAVINFDRLGVMLTLAGADVEDAPGNYQDGDLNGTTVVIEPGTGGSFQIGPHHGAQHRIEIGIDDMRATGVELNLGITSVSRLLDARASIQTIDSAITRVTRQRGDIGAVQNRLSFVISYTDNEIRAIQASESTVRDADMAEEVAEFTRSQILVQAATAMLSQANVIPQAALTLLRG